MNKKTWVAVIVAIVLILAVFLIDARFGILTKKMGLNTEVIKELPVDFRIEETIVLETYTGSVSTQKCGDIGMTLMFKENNNVTRTQDQGKCKNDKHNIISEGVYTKKDDGSIDIVFKGGEKVFLKKDSEKLVLNQDGKLSFFEKTNIINYKAQDGTLAQIEYAKFEGISVAKVITSDNIKTLVREEKTTGEYSNMTYTLKISKGEASLSTATTTILFLQE